MHILNLVVPASIAGLVIFGVAAKPRRRSDVDLVAALKQVHDLFPFTETEEMDDKELWFKRIGAVRGLRQMLHRRLAMMLAGRDLALGVSGVNVASDLWRDIFLCGLILWWVGWATILLEVPFQALLRRYKIGRVPRIGARASVQLYCDMGTALDLFTTQIPSAQKDEQYISG